MRHAADAGRAIARDVRERKIAVRTNAGEIMIVNGQNQTSRLRHGIEQRVVFDFVRVDDACLVQEARRAIERLDGVEGARVGVDVAALRRRVDERDPMTARSQSHREIMHVSLDAAVKSETWCSEDDHASPSVARRSARCIDA
jgi:hypothetical protein